MESLAKVTQPKLPKKNKQKKDTFFYNAMNKKRYITLQRARGLSQARTKNAHAREHFARADEDGGKTQHRRGCRLTTENIVKFIMRQSRMEQLRRTGAGGRARGLRLRLLWAKVFAHRGQQAKTRLPYRGNYTA